MTGRTPAPGGWAAVSDFDGTITLQDVGDWLLLHYGYCDKRAIAASYSPKVRVEDFMKKAFAGAKLSKADITGFVNRKVKARRGFRGFVSFCARNAIPLEVASGGMDLYAAPFFRKHGIAIKAFFGKTRVTAGGIRITYPFLKGTDLGTFKAARVLRLRRAGRKVVFFGDGPSDLKAASLADKVFAAGRLLKLCRARGITATPLSSFARAATFLKKTGRQAGLPLTHAPS